MRACAAHDTLRYTQETPKKHPRNTQRHTQQSPPEKSRAPLTRQAASTWLAARPLMVSSCPRNTPTCVCVCVCVRAREQARPARTGRSYLAGPSFPCLLATAAEAQHSKMPTVGKVDAPRTRTRSIAQPLNHKNTLPLCSRTCPPAVLSVPHPPLPISAAALSLHRRILPSRDPLHA